MFTSIEYIPQNRYYVGSTGEVRLTHGDTFVYSYQIFGDTFTPRECFKRISVIQRLYEQGCKAGDASAIAQLRGSLNAFDLWYHPAWPIADDFKADERPNWYPVAETECEGEEIINDWLTDAYMAEFGLECGAECEPNDIYHFFGLNYADDMPMPSWLSAALQLEDEPQIRRFPVGSFTEDYYERHHSQPVTY